MTIIARLVATQVANIVVVKMNLKNLTDHLVMTTRIAATNVAVI